MPQILNGTPSLREALSFDTAPVLAFRQDPAAPPPLGETAVYYSETEARWTRVKSLANGDVELDEISVEDAVKWFRTHGQPLPSCLDTAFLVVRQGDRWLIQDGVQRGYVKHSKGMSYIALLLLWHHQHISTNQLVSFVARTREDTHTTQVAAETRDEPTQEESRQVSRRQDSIDAETLIACKQDMARLIDAIAEAQAAGCKDEENRCRRDFYSIAKYLTKVMPRRGKKRSSGPQGSLDDVLQQCLAYEGQARPLQESDGSDKSRTAVANAITRALANIAKCKQLEATAAFLKTNLELGVTCSYVPDLKLPCWVVEL